MTRSLICLALAGCAVVFPKDREDLTAQIDADGDGVPGLQDCDDANPFRYPGAEEDVADGIDNDCDGADLVDVDGDQYPVVTRAEYVAMVVANGLAASEDEVSWPANVFDGPVDCDDADGDIYPGRFDAPYDGIDADCGRENDFDADGDGQMPVGTDPAAVQAYIDATGVAIDLQDVDAFADCNDEDPSILRGAPSDPLYDGHDGDCDGSNDFDADGDGFHPASLDAAFDQFVERYHPDPLVAPAWLAVAAPGDCLDQPHVDVSVAPELVYPGADDVPYDGVDADCAGDSDFDSDGDGYTVLDQDTAIDAYRALWATGSPPSFEPTLGTDPDVEPGDCDDTVTTVRPGALEGLGDALDSDCDGGVDTTPLAYGDVSWEDPRPPRIALTSEHYVIAGTGETLVRYLSTGNTPFPDAAPFFTFLREPSMAPGYQAEPTGLQLWTNTNPVATTELAPGFELLGLEGALFTSHSGLGVNGFDVLGVTRHLLELTGTYGSQGYGFSTPFDGFDADLDASVVADGALSGWSFTVACGAAGREDPGGAPLDADGRVRFAAIPLAFQQADPPLIDPSLEGRFVTTGNTADVCWVRSWRDDADTVRAEAHVCDADGCLLYDLVVDEAGPTATITPSGPSPYAGRGIVAADVHDDLLITLETAGVVVEDAHGGITTLFAGQQVHHADAVVADGILYAAAVVELAGERTVQLVHGPSDGSSPLVQVAYPVADTDPRFQGGIGCTPSTGVGCESGRLLEPTGVQLAVDDLRVVLAVSATPPAGYVPSSPFAGSGPAPHGAIGWAFFAPAP